MLPLGPGRTVQNGARARRFLRLASVAVAGVMLAAPAMAQVAPPTGNGSSGGGRGSKFPVEFVVPLVAIGVLMITSAASSGSEGSRGRRERAVEPDAVAPPEGAIALRPEAKPLKPRNLNQIRSKPRVAGGGGGAGGARPLAGASAAGRQAGQSDDPAILVPGEVLFETQPGLSTGGVAALARRVGLERISSETFDLTGQTIHRYRIRGRRSVASVVAQLVADPRVRSAQANHVYSLSQQEASDLASTQYAVAKMRLTEAHQAATGVGVAVAIIDSGADASHPALGGAIVETFDPVGGDPKPHPHGTAIAGLVAGRGELASPAPAARLLMVRAFSGEKRPAKPGAEGTTVHILRGLDWAAKRGAKVVNMSFAGPQDDKIGQFVAAGIARGQIFVAAAGNAGPSSPPLYPAADPNVIAVTATDAGDKLLNVANRGAYLAVSAPGVDVVVAAPGGGYSYMSGTSMAAAEVSGVVALLAQEKPALSASEARAVLASTAIDLGAPGPDADFGAGVIDAKAALDATISPAAAGVR